MLSQLIVCLGLVLCNSNNNIPECKCPKKSEVCKDNKSCCKKDSGRFIVISNNKTTISIDTRDVDFVKINSKGNLLIKIKGVRSKFKEWRKVNGPFKHEKPACQNKACKCKNCKCDDCKCGTEKCLDETCKKW